MNKKPNTRRALVLSCLSLLLCISMLIGSTFAWFTDNASTKVSNIVSGTLAIGLYKDAECKNTAEGQVLGFVDKDGNAIAAENVKWEPGASFIISPVYLKNEGNLWVKYGIEISGYTSTLAATGEDLAEVIDVTVEGTKIGTLKDLKDKASNGSFVVEKTIEPGEVQSFGGNIVLKMQEGAGNAYQGLSLSDLAITIRGTQATVENDSYTDQYDKDAKYATNTSTVFATGTHTVDLSNTDYIVTGDDIAKDFAAIKVNETSSATITGNGTVKVDVEQGVKTAIAVWARNGGDIVIENGNYILNRAEGNNEELELIYASDVVNDGDTTTITIKGGTFKCDNAYKTLNIHGSGAYNDAEAFIYVQGGTFWNFNPATDSEDDHVIVPDSYKVVSEEKADGTWYTVVTE